MWPRQQARGLTTPDNKPRHWLTKDKKLSSNNCISKTSHSCSCQTLPSNSSSRCSVQLWLSLHWPSCVPLHAFDRQPPAACCIPVSKHYQPATTRHPTDWINAVSLVQRTCVPALHASQRTTGCHQYAKEPRQRPCMLDSRMYGLAVQAPACN